MKFVKQTFLEQAVDLDFNLFEDCKFERCKLVYRGFGTVSLAGCSFTEVEWMFTDAAGNTVNFMRGLYHGAGEGGRELIDKTFENIRKGSAPTATGRHN